VRVRIPLLVVLLGVALGALSGGAVGGVKGFVYALALSVAAELVSIIPVAGPLIVWFWLIPLFRRAVGVGEEMILVDALVTAFSALLNALVTLALVLALAKVLRFTKPLRRL